MTLINPIPILPIGFQPITPVTPFTYRDGITYIDLMEELKCYISDNLVPWIIKELDAEQGDVQGIVNDLIEQFNLAVTAMLNGSVLFNDSVSTALFEDVNSEFRSSLNAAYQSQITALNTLTTTGRLGVDDLTNTFGAVVMPFQFGADGDGATNDSAALNDALSYLADKGGGTLVLPRGARFHIPSGITLDTPGVSIVSEGGVLGGGPIRIGKTSGTGDAVDFSNSTVDVLYDGNDAFGTAKGIILRRARGVTLKGRVKNVGVGVSADAADGAEGFHTLGMVQVRDMTIGGVNYGIFGETSAWDVLSDWTIDGLTVNFAKVKAISLAGMGGTDGFKLVNSLLFGLAYTQAGTALYDAKEELVHVGKTNQAIVSNTHFFESGLSALRFDELTNLTATGNIFTWSGQRQQRDAIEINGGTPRGAIVANMFDGWTRAAVGIHGGDPARLEVGPNGYRNDFAGAWNKTGATLSTLNTYRHFVASAVTNLAPSSRDHAPAASSFDSVKGSVRITARDRKSDRAGVSGAKRRAVAVTADNTVIFSLEDLRESAVYGGLLHVHARSVDTDDAKTADYLLFVSDDETRTSQMAVISELGYIAGSAATDPAFTWNLSGSSLRVTPKGSTSGSFFFEMTALGAVAGY